MNTTKKLTAELIEESRTTGYLLAVIDARDIMIRLKAKCPEALGVQILFEFSDELDKAMSERKVTSMALKESDLNGDETTNI